jgi:phage baseplate assembly protein W
MVDTKRIDKITSARNVSRDPFYSDLLVKFDAHPETGYLTRSTDAQAIKRALRNLILTNKGERLYQPKIGCSIRRVLFEDISAVSSDMLKTFISDAIASYEPRVKLIEVLVEPNETYNLYEVSIIYEIINNSVPQALSLTLYRVR